MNPARRLFDTLTEWKEMHTGLSSASNARELSEDWGMLMQLRALDDLRLLASGIDELEREGVRVSTYRRYLSAWRDMTLAYPWGWTGAVDASEAYPAGALDQLENLADWFDLRRLPLSNDGKHLLSDALLAVDEELANDATISDKLRAYIRRLLREIRAALDDEALDGRFDYNEAVLRLYTALRTVAEDATTDEQKARWGDVIKRFFYDSSVAVIGGAPSTLLALTGVMPA